MAARFSGPGQPYEGLAKYLEKPDGTRVPRWTGEIRVIEKHMMDPLRWSKPRMVFVNSMSDLFHEKLADEDIDRIFAVMGLASQHTFQPLTKRADRLSNYLNNPDLFGRVLAAAQKMADGRSLSIQRRVNAMREALMTTGFLPNVWWGVSAEDQKAADERIPSLLEAPAAVRWVSYEPALGMIDFTRINQGNLSMVDALSGRTHGHPGIYGPRLNWVVMGGESDQHPQKAHDYRVEWALATQTACAEAGVAFFHKQLGSSPSFYGEPVAIRDRMGKDEADWPPQLRGAQAYPVRGA